MKGDPDPSSLSVELGERLDVSGKAQSFIEF